MAARQSLLRPHTESSQVRRSVATRKVASAPKSFIGDSKDWSAFCSLSGLSEQVDKDQNLKDTADHHLAECGRLHESLRRLHEAEDRTKADQVCEAIGYHLGQFRECISALHRRG